MRGRPPLGPKARAHADAGLSLIELVIAMAVFALVAVMGVQSLTGTLRISERLTEIDAETAELGNAIALLRNDLAAVVPMLFYPPQSTPLLAVSQSEDGQSFGLSLAGQGTLGPSHTDRHRVEWKLDAATGVLSRHHWPTLVPAQTDQQSDAMPVLGDVRGFALRSFWSDVGWIAGVTPPFAVQLALTETPTDQDGGTGPPAPVYYSTLPLALELIVQTGRHGDLRLVQTLQ